MKGLSQQVQPCAAGTPYFPAAHFPIDLSISENPLGPSSAVLDAVRSATQLAAYPVEATRMLTETLANHWRVDAKAITLGAGIDDVLAAIVSTFLAKGDEVVLQRPTFPKIAYYAEMRAAKITHVASREDLRADFAGLRNAVTRETKILYICNPNNPTGLIEERRKIADLATDANCLVVVDEANGEFAGTSNLADVANCKNLIVLRTFSKAYGLAAARVGYAISSCEVAESLARARPRFAVSGPAMLMAAAAMSDHDHLRRTCEFVCSESKQLQSALAKRHFTVVPALANCFVAQVPPPFADADALLQRIQPLGGSFVPGAHFGLAASQLRIAPREARLNRRFLEILDCVLESTG